MSSSLDSLVNNLAKGGHEFWGFENYNCCQLELLIRKGIYPYECMDSWDKFKETRLPSIEKFYSNLNMSGVSDGDYQYACKVWREFGIRNMGETKNDFEKDFYKLMNNSVFGKTMENIRNHRNIKLVNNEEEYLKNVMKPNFKSGTLLGPDLMVCEMGKVKVIMN